MGSRKHRLALLAPLIIAVLGTMALASTAQAATPLFNVGGSVELEATISGVQEGTGTLLVPNSNLSVQCSEFEVLEGLLLKGGAIGHVKLLYKGCKSFEHKSPFAELPCHVSDVVGGKPELLQVTASALLLPVEFADGTFGVLAEKLAAQINFLPETACPLPLKNIVKGEACFKITSGNNTSRPLIKSNTTIQTECPEVKLEGTGEVKKDKLLFGVNEAFFVGSAELFGAGAHASKTIGVSLISPTLQLCKTKEGSCEPYALGSKISANLEQEVKFVFPYEEEELEPPCRVSSVSGTTTKEGEVVIGEITALTFKECGGGVCTVVSQHLPYKFEIKATTEGNGTMTWSSGGSGSPAFAIKCLGLAKCIYGAAEMAFTVTGGGPAKLSNSGVALKQEEGSEKACGVSGAKWEGIAAVEGKIMYKITAPSPLFTRLIWS